MRMQMRAWQHASVLAVAIILVVMAGAAAQPTPYPDDGGCGVRCATVGNNVGDDTPGPTTAPIPVPTTANLTTHSDMKGDNNTKNENGMGHDDDVGGTTRHSVDVGGTIVTGLVTQAPQVSTTSHGAYIATNTDSNTQSATTTGGHSTQTNTNTNMQSQTTTNSNTPTSGGHSVQMLSVATDESENVAGVPSNANRDHRTVGYQVPEVPQSIHRIVTKGLQVPSFAIAITGCLGLTVFGAVFAVARRRTREDHYRSDQDFLSITPVYECDSVPEIRHASMSSPWQDRDLFMGEAPRSYMSDPFSWASNMSDSMSVSNLGTNSLCSSPADTISEDGSTTSTSTALPPPGRLTFFSNNLQHELRAEIAQMQLSMRHNGLPPNEDVPARLSRHRSRSGPQPRTQVEAAAPESSRHVSDADLDLERELAAL